MAGTIGVWMDEEIVPSRPAVSEMPTAFCRGCGYALVGLSEQRCPECGRTFDMSRPRSFSRRPLRGWAWRWGRRAVLLALSFVIVVGLGAGWLWHGWRGEQKTIGQLEGWGTNITFKTIGPEWLGTLLGDRFGYLRIRVSRVEINGAPKEFMDALELSDFARLDHLEIGSCEFSNVFLRKVGTMASLEELGIYGFPSDVDFVHLERLTNLKRLDLGTQTDDAMLLHFQKLKGLKHLELQSTAVTDAGLKSLRGLVALRELDLDNTAITDAGLEHLSGLSSLQYLSVGKTHVTAVGIRKLKQAIPGLFVNEVYREYPDGDGDKGIPDFAYPPTTKPSASK